MSAAHVAHPGELELRRFEAGEALGGDVQSHVSACADCQARLAALRDEQRKFEAEIPFERFAAGVERAQRRPAPPTTVRGSSVLAVMAAIVTVLVGVTYALRVAQQNQITSRVKGGISVDTIIAGTSGAQRPASLDPSVPDQLVAGDRVRVGVSTPEPRQVAVLTIDDRGVISTAYAAAPLDGSATVQFLPDSLEFTGSGQELVVVIVGREVSVPAAAAELKRRFDTVGGDLKHLGPLAIEGETFQRLFVKP